MIRRRLWRLALLGVLWTALSSHAFSGCRGLFTPAVPEPPSGQTIVADYRSPEGTLSTMEAGLEAKGKGSSVWVGAFADSSQPTDGPAYHHFFDSGDIGVFEAACACEAPADWRAPQEQTFFQALLDVRPSDEYVALFEARVDKPDPPATESQAVLYRKYEVRATAPDGTSTLIIARGFADLTITRFASNWLVTRWEDHIDPEADPTDPYQVTLGRRRLESTR